MIGSLAAPQPGLMINPAFIQWTQMAQAWQAERERRMNLFRQAVETLRQDAATSYKIDIEADSTIAADEQAEKQSRTEFLQAMTPFFGTMIPLAKQNPDLADLIKEVIKFGVRAFPASRQLDDAFDEALDKLGTGPQQPPEQHGNTKSPMEIQAEAASEKGKMQVQQQANAVHLAEIFSDQQIQQQRLQLDAQKSAAELALAQRTAQTRETIAAARLSHMAASDQRGLV